MTVRELAVAFASVALPVALAGLLVSADIRTDLWGLRPQTHPRQPIAPADGTLVGWQDLGRYAERTAAPPMRVRVLGYMIYGEQPSRDGALVNTFTLMPSAGWSWQSKHSSVRAMIDVRPRGATTFRNRTLVWLSGILLRSNSLSRDKTALYTILDAQLETAHQRQITEYFVP